MKLKRIANRRAERRIEPEHLETCRVDRLLKSNKFKSCSFQPMDR